MEIKKETRFIDKAISFLTLYNKILLVEVDKIGSKQLQQLRIKLRGEGELLLGKNEMKRKAILEFTKRTNSTKLIKLMPYIRGNVGLIFFKEDLLKVKEIVSSIKEYGYAIAGEIAPQDVIVPEGPTGLNPQQTSYYASLNIATKITKGQIEIINEVTIAKKGEIIGFSVETIMKRLEIKPFCFQPQLGILYDDGFICDSRSIDPSYLLEHFQIGVRNIAQLCLSIGYPTDASIPYSIQRGYLNCLLGAN